MKDAQQGDSTNGAEADKPRVSLLRTWRCVGLRSSGIVSLNHREESSLGLSSLCIAGCVIPGRLRLTKLLHAPGQRIS